jgi:hypothetical protein
MFSLSNGSSWSYGTGNLTPPAAQRRASQLLPLPSQASSHGHDFEVNLRIDPDDDPSCTLSMERVAGGVHNAHAQAPCRSFGF